MNSKAKGTKNEHRSIRLLEAAGYACTRAAASLGAWDIIGVGLFSAQLAEVQARDTYAKARITLDQAIGTTLQNRHIDLDEALRGRLNSKPRPDYLAATTA